MNNKDILYILAYALISSIYCFTLVKYRYKTIEIYSPKTIFNINLITILTLLTFCVLIFNIKNVLQYVFLFFYFYILNFLITSKSLFESLLILICCAHVTYMVYNIQNKQRSPNIFLNLSLEQEDIKQSLISIFRHLNNLIPTLIFFALIYYLQVYIYVNTFYKNLVEKYLISFSSVLLLNLFMWIFAKLFIKNNFEISLEKKIVNIGISILSGVYIFEENNISEILVLVGYIYMIGVNRIYLRNSNRDFFKYSLMFYSNTSIFSWIMACVSYYSVENGNLERD